MKTARLFPLLALLSLATGCATYVTPGGQADLSTFTDPDVKKAFSARPAITFPANIAMVRVQAPGYRSDSASGFGSGAYSIVTARDVETEADVQAISSLPGVAGVVTLNRLLLPSELNSDLDIRGAAAKLQAEAVLVYTLHTEFNDGSIIAPLTTLSLGLAPNKTYKVNSTASAILMDTKTGFVYGALEEISTRSGVTIAWGGRDVMDNARKKAEREALDKLIASFGPFWQTVYQRHR